MPTDGDSSSENSSTAAKHAFRRSRSSIQDTKRHLEISGPSTYFRDGISQAKKREEGLKSSQLTPAVPRQYQYSFMTKSPTPPSPPPFACALFIHVYAVSFFSVGQERCYQCGSGTSAAAGRVHSGQSRHKQKVLSAPS
jgi:hypothetical protein